MKEFNTSDILEVNSLCVTIRTLLEHDEYERCESLICESMGRFPHSAVPHNLFGVLLEKKGRHPEAMKHFRAAWALDQTYIPARVNLEYFSSFNCYGKCAIDESDCNVISIKKNKIYHDEHGIGHIVKENIE